MFDDTNSMYGDMSNTAYGTAPVNQEVAASLLQPGAPQQTRMGNMQFGGAYADPYGASRGAQTVNRAMARPVNQVTAPAPAPANRPSQGAQQIMPSVPFVRGPTAAPGGVTPAYVPVDPSFWWTTGPGQLVSSSGDAQQAAATGGGGGGVSWGTIIVGLGVVAAIGGGIYWWTNRKNAPTKRRSKAVDDDEDSED